MNESKHYNNSDMPSYASTNYLEWLNPGLSEEKRARQEEIHRRMSHMMAEAYWRELRDRKQAWWNEQ